MRQKVKGQREKIRSNLQEKPKQFKFDNKGQRIRETDIIDMLSIPEEKEVRQERKGKRIVQYIDGIEVEDHKNKDIDDMT